MKTALNLRQANVQTLTMTPQLQQAIRLLQLSSVELQVEIQENIEKNPLLELDENSVNSNIESLNALEEKEYRKERSDDDFNPFNNDRTITDDEANYSTNDYSSNNDTVQPINEPSDNGNIDKDAWNNNPISTKVSAKTIDSDDLYEGETKYELKDHLMWQLNVTRMTDKDRFISEFIIDGINESGYLEEKIEDILLTVRETYPDTDEAEILSVLKLIQHFDPIGIASRNVKESLLIQLSQYDMNDEINQLAYKIINENIDLLGTRDYKTIIKKLNIKNEDKFKSAIALITHLEPRPGNCIKENKREFIIPDVAVIKRSGKWTVELNPNSIPKLKINETYAEITKNASTSDAQYIKTHLQEANWFIQSLNKRNETLLKVANYIVEAQKDFFEKGEHAMKPMVLNDVAEAVGMHESTISRVTTEKYIYTPKGTYELKYFFSSHVNTENGGEFSSTAIRAMIKELISNENPEKPLSDNQISDILKNRGIMVARRTIAKYRESLNILSSSQRKRLV
ncbi:MAG: RNA polymerase factor sigma-54 [Succinivibrionaceae bacterium]